MKIGGKNFWVFKISEPITINTLIKDVEFENEWILLLPDGDVTVKASSETPFCWDGATPKFNILDIVIGTPDGVVDMHTGKAKTYYATLLHDALYQFAPRGLVSRKQADKIMLEEMRKTKFKPRLIYYAVIRLLGGLWWNKKRRYVW